ncbi:hypothetical protein H072_2580 [Dactylellina haptotyla CBS 200.50]|uniref:Signal peptidase complex subunit 1 n=1 Tax=Dactylellina haptotyla (strain CBS 200.50) TaxID=1284197 RepID=S8BVF8_DACHA|nr:hypothetical protein H072_2580 [Dactylellina haptotyla CBS 200.50]
MEAIQDQFQAIVDGFIDFKGQKLAEQITTYTLSVSAILAFLIGFATQNIVYTLYVGLAGTGLTFLAVVPPWPVYNQAPVKFLSASGNKSAGGGVIIVDGQEVKVKT